ncbi:uncharacterized protein LOC104908041 [Beta vulgaris subsp. vulgaris]|uniref:uncharacterized protein LOC104908041 n=1 Tax=Beta vulgaris subsp. vulgaris TaxID=3555 RepID=UPI00053FD1D6|nr:uncharacterized protein LOC104908041 [Beta vulgaris subsp. vulgaris]
MVLWNKAALLKQLWAFYFKQDKLWVRWVHAYYINRGAIDTVTINSNTSWLLRKILDSRELLRDICGWEEVSNTQKFSIKKAYNHLQEGFDRVSWRRLICNNQATPKSKFILWMALLNRLATTDRISKWKRDCNTLCKLCGVQEESVQHLFFECEYSKSIWNAVLQYIELSPVNTAVGELRRVVQKARSKRSKDKLFVMLYTESLYAIWLQRNSKHSKDSILSPHAVIKEVIFKVACNCNENDRCRLLLV